MIIISASVGMIVYWRVPGLSLQAHDTLIRMRGPLQPSSEIVIVAIDEKSLARFGRFPWPRELMAGAIEKMAAASPRVIGLDVLYADSSDPGSDDALATAIRRAGNVVAAAQLIAEPPSRDVSWLKPLPAIENSAAGIGHVNIAADRDGVARTILLRQIDDQGDSLLAMTVELIRVGRGLGHDEIRDWPDSVRLGNLRIPVIHEPFTVPVSRADSESDFETTRAARMTIDYAGPPGAFAGQTVSIADLIDGKIAPERLKGKYLIVGATATSLGDKLASPFTGTQTDDGNQNATLMSGAEILANSVNTVLEQRFYSTTSDRVAALLAVLIAAATILVLTLAQGRGEGLISLLALGSMSAIIIFVTYLFFIRFLVELPLVPMFLSFGTAVPLTFLWRSLGASAEIDRRIADLMEQSLDLGQSRHPGLEDYNKPQTTPAPLIAHLTQADAVCLLLRNSESKSGNHYQVMARHGAPVVSRGNVDDHFILQLSRTPFGSVNEALMHDEDASRYFVNTGLEQRSALTLRLGGFGENKGALIIACSPSRLPDPETLTVCRELASNWLASEICDRQKRPHRRLKLPSGPRGLQWKIRRLGGLQRQLLRRTGFVDRTMRSIEDGLVITGADGYVTFANPRACQIFGLTEAKLLGKNLFQQLLRAALPDQLDVILTRLIVDRAPIEREVAMGPEISNQPPRHYNLRMAVVCDGDKGEGAVTGIVATLSDITRQHELQQIKNDIMALVTHELRTPITAIQGMSEILTQHEYNENERREMYQAINEEAHRLARLINEYLDLTTLESGSRSLRRSPIKVTPLLERALLLLEPLAGQRNVMIRRRFAPNLPVFLADQDLLTQAVNNLVTNAIKYSPAGREVIVEAVLGNREIMIKVADHGHGISQTDLEHIFEKFYRVARIEDADVPGTGLGLPFVREVALMHGGQVSVESEVGVGSVFTLHLPLTNE